MISAMTPVNPGLHLLSDQLLIEFAGRLHSSIFTIEDVSVYRYGVYKQSRGSWT